uniref:Uncharacterized protein n=2 Tax=Anguilla anguilla TaxID=7936 RepID=A0A0E9V2C6_ANGAN
MSASLILRPWLFNKRFRERWDSVYFWFQNRIGPGLRSDGRKARLSTLIPCSRSFVLFISDTEKEYSL